MSNWRKFNKRLFTKGPLHDFRAAVGLVRVGTPLALLGLMGTSGSITGAQGMERLLERTDNRSKDLEWRGTAAHSLPLEEGAWNIHVSASLYPSDCLLMLSGTELKRNPALPTDQCLWGHRAEWRRLETRSAGANRA